VKENSINFSDILEKLPLILGNIRVSMNRQIIRAKLSKNCRRRYFCHYGITDLFRLKW